MSDPCFVYLAISSSRPGQTKVGITANLYARRLALMKKYALDDLEFARLWKLPNKAQALGLEQMFLHRLRLQKTDGEWFQGAPNTALYVLYEEAMQKGAVMFSSRSAPAELFYWAEIWPASYKKVRHDESRVLGFLDEIAKCAVA